MKCIYKKATPNFKIFKKRARAFIERNKSEELSICEEPNQDYSNALNTISMLKNDQSYELDISAFLNDLLILVYYPADYNIFEIIDESVCKEILKILINLHPIDQVELIQRVCNVITVLNTIPDSRYVQYFSDNGAINIIISKYRENTSQLF